MESLRDAATFNLGLNDLVVVKVKGRNEVGWATDYSDENSTGANVETAPQKPNTPTQGSNTDDTIISIEWNASTGDQAGGSTISVYAVYWD